MFQTNKARAFPEQQNAYAAARVDLKEHWQTPLTGRISVSDQEGRQKSRLELRLHPPPPFGAGLESSLAAISILVGAPPPYYSGYRLQSEAFGSVSAAGRKTSTTVPDLSEAEGLQGGTFSATAATA